MHSLHNTIDYFFLVPAEGFFDFFDEVLFFLVTVFSGYNDADGRKNAI